jgi:hypothetical protein
MCRRFQGPCRISRTLGNSVAEPGVSLPRDGARAVAVRRAALVHNSAE